MFLVTSVYHNKKYWNILKILILGQVKETHKNVIEQGLAGQFRTG